MPVINHDYKDINSLENIIRHNDGTPLYGEIEMYRRIYTDCENSIFLWHFWHDLHLPIGNDRQAEIQIDFFLVCEKGAIVVEVKGGGVGIHEGNFYFTKRNGTFMERSPFQQAEDYKYALINNKVINSNQIFIDTICAFPHTAMLRTNNNPSLDYGYKLWSSIQQKDESKSFADFCIDVLSVDKERKKWYAKDLDSHEVEIAINSLLCTIKPDFNYLETSYQSIIEWLNIQNLETFKSLEKNDRIIIEGGPGTGKTTIAKAFIRRYKTLHGVYLCWNKFLAATIKNELNLVGLEKCEVYQYISFFSHLDPNHKFISFEDFQDSSIDLVKKINVLLKECRNRKSFIPYDYIIIDEAQDLFDKGASVVLNSLTSITDSGLGNGRYLLFFDTEQGYNKGLRELDDYAANISRFGAHFILSENKRVPTNRQIVDVANKVLASGDDREATEFILEIEKVNDSAIKIFHFAGANELIRYVKKLLNKLREGDKKWHDYVLLTDSHSKNLYDRLADIELIKELNLENIMYNECKLSMTSILSYKGLETKHVLLILNNRETIDKFELYVGMTRAMFDIEFLLIE